MLVCPYYHTSYDDTQDPRQRATHHVGQGAVPQYQLREPHSAVGAAAHLYSTLRSPYQQAFLSLLSKPPLSPLHSPIFSSPRRPRSILSSDLLFSGPAANHRHPHGEISKGRGQPDPLSSSHVRTLPDVASRWGLASALARLASSRLRFVRIFSPCFSGFGACFARHKSGAGHCNAGDPGPCFGFRRRSG